MKKRDCTFYVAKNKDTDQLRSYHAADLQLCFHVCKKKVISGRSSFSFWCPSMCKFFVIALKHKVGDVRNSYSLEN